MNDSAPDPLHLRDTVVAMLRAAANARGHADPAGTLLELLTSLAPWRERADVIMMGAALHAAMRAGAPAPPALKIQVALAAEGLRRADLVRDLLQPLVPPFAARAESSEVTDTTPESLVAAAIARRSDLHLGFFAASATLAHVEAALPDPTGAAGLSPDIVGIETTLTTALAAAMHGYALRAKSLFDKVLAIPAASTDLVRHARFRAALGLAAIAWRESDFDACATFALRAANHAAEARAPWEQHLATWFAGAARYCTGNALPALEPDAFAFAAPPDLGTSLFGALPLEPLAGPVRAGAVPMAEALSAAITERTIAIDPAGISLVAVLGAALVAQGHGAIDARALVASALDAICGMPGGVGSSWYKVLKRLSAASAMHEAASHPAWPPLPWLPRVRPGPATDDAVGLGTSGATALPDVRDLAVDMRVLADLFQLETFAPPAEPPPFASTAATAGTLAPPTNPEAFLAPDYLWRYQCNGQGCCCGGWRAGLTESDLHRLEHLTTGTTLEPLVQNEILTPIQGPFAAWLPPRSGRPAGYATQVGQLRFAAPNHRCSLLVDDRLCSIHQDLGEHALPDVCQIFPISSRVTELGTLGAWDLVCPEVARRLAEADGPARLVPRPADVGRSFRADPGRPPEAPRTVDTRVQLDRFQHHAFRQALASAFGTCADRPLAVLAAAIDVLVEWEASGMQPDFDFAMRACVGPSFLPHVLEAIAQRIAYPWDPMAEVAGHIDLCRNFFRHHPWGTELTLDPLAAAFDPVTGRLGWPVAALRWLRSSTPPVDMVMSNHLMALFSEPEPSHGNLFGEVAAALGRVGDTVLIRGVMGESPELRVARGIFTAAIVFADLPHRRSDDGYTAFGEALRDTLTRPLDPCPDTPGSLFDLQGTVADHVEQ